MKKALLTVLVLTSGVFAQAADKLPQTISCDVILHKQPVYENGEQVYHSETLAQMDATITRQGNFEHIVTSKETKDLLVFVNITSDGTTAGLYDHASGAMADLNVKAALSKVRLTLTSSNKLSVLNDPTNLSLELNCE